MGSQSKHLKVRSRKSALFFSSFFFFFFFFSFFCVPLSTTTHDKAILRQHQVNVFKALVMSSKLNIFVKYFTPWMPEIFKDLDLTTVHYNLEKDRDLIAIKTAADQVDQVAR